MTLYGSICSNRERMVGHSYKAQVDSAAPVASQLSRYGLRGDEDWYGCRESRQRHALSQNATSPGLTLAQSQGCRSINTRETSAGFSWSPLTRVIACCLPA